MPPFASIDDFLLKCAISWAAIRAPKAEMEARSAFAPMAFPDSQLAMRCAQCGYGTGIESIDLECHERCVNCGWSKECGAP